MFLKEEVVYNKEFVLSNITEENIFCYYMSISNVDFKKKYKNPLRDDLDAGCRFYVNKNSKKLYFNDFAWRSFDCFDYVKEMYLLFDFKDVIFKICSDFKLLDVDTKVTKKIITTKAPQIKNRISFDIKKWDKELLQYWKNHISWLTIEDLEEYNIFPFYRYYINKELKYTNNKDIAFLYRLDKHMFQLYAPYKLMKNLKFLTTGTKILGLKSVDYTKKYIVIVKSYKDFFLARKLGVNCIGILSESIYLSLDAIFCIEKFDIAFTLFDNDFAGIRHSVRFKNNYGTTPLLFNRGEPKDLADNLLRYGENDVFNLILETAESLNLFL